MKKTTGLLIKLLNSYLLLSLSLVVVGTFPQQVKAGATALRIAVGTETATDIHYAQIESWLNYWGLQYSEVTDFTNVSQGQYDVIIYGRASQASQYYLTDVELNSLRNLFGNGTNLIFMDGYDKMNNTRKTWETFEWNVLGINMSNTFGDVGLQNWRILKRNAIDYDVAPEWQAMLNDSSVLTYFGDMRYVSGSNTATEILGSRYGQFTNRTLFTVNTDGSDRAYLIQPPMVYINRSRFQTDNNVVLADAMFRYAIDEISLRLLGEYATRHTLLYSSFEIDDWLGSADVQTSLANLHANHGLKITFVVPHIESEDVGENIRLAGLQYFKNHKDWIEARSHSYRHQNHNKLPQSYLDSDPSLMIQSLLDDGVPYPYYVTFQGHYANRTVLDAWAGYATHILGISQLTDLANLANGSLYAGYKGLQLWERIDLSPLMQIGGDNSSTKVLAWRIWSQNHPMIFYDHGQWSSPYGESVYTSFKSWVESMGGRVVWTSEVIQNTIETTKLASATSSGVLLDSSTASLTYLGSKESHIIIPVSSECHADSIYYDYSSLGNRIDVYPIAVNVASITLTAGTGKPHLSYIPQDNFVQTLYHVGSTFSSFSDEKLAYTIYGISGTTIITKVFVGEKGEPTMVLIDDIAQSIDYSSSTRMLAITAKFSSKPTEIVVDWNPHRPQSSFFYSPLNPHVRDAVTFNASDSRPYGGYIVSCQWDFGDGFLGQGMLVSHIYDTLGTYKVTLNVTDSERFWSSTTAEVTVTMPAAPSIWKVEHQPKIPDYRDNVTITANITSTESLIGVVILNHFDGSKWVNLTMTTENELYTATIPALAYGTTVQYRIYASNDVGNWAETGIATYTVADPLPPSLGQLQTSPQNPSAGEDVFIYAQVSEPALASGIKSVTLIWVVFGGKSGSSPMMLEGDVFTTSIPGQDGDTLVLFVIESYDVAGNRALSESYSYKVRVAGTGGFLVLIAAITATLASFAGVAFFIIRKRKAKIQEPAHIQKTSDSHACLGRGRNALL